MATQRLIMSGGGGGCRGVSLDNVSDCLVKSLEVLCEQAELPGDY